MRKRIVIAVLGWTVAVAASVAPTACVAPGGGPGPDATPVPPDEVRQLIAGHNRRVAQLATLTATGVIELQWVDAAGETHFEPQVNARLWLVLPRRTALRAEKLGDDLFWIGSDDVRYWLFDLLAEEDRLHVGRHEEPADVELQTALPIRPLALVDLLALTPLPEPGAAADGTIEATAEAIVVTAPGAGGPMRVRLSRATGLPTSVESLGDAGAVTLSSTLARPRSVVVPGISRASLPRMPTLVDITGTDLSVKLALGKVTADPPPDVFDLRRLIEYLRPVVIDGDLTP